ncbi:MAG: tetratricopeptide repeat protein [Bradyrhizobium sp.]|uniref:tetratricopeptide repeat protein n=1 Tax=Bradyrhizobium sp. TaxID=376 RepID=UPI001DCAB688|nr:tetratricopeptide repeat protein [Bradyrhizobium sp.]MBV9566038.1 tetratricopeptide repeat protein [Bradyrhizobium sp.]
MNRRERRASARKSQKAPTKAGVVTPAALYASGVTLLQSGHLMEAQVCCQHALAIDPEHADTLHLMGQISLAAGQNDHAVEWLTRALGKAPTADNHAALGVALHRLGRRDEALHAFDKAVQFEPNLVNWKNLAGVLFEMQRMDAAHFAYQEVLKLAPRDWEAACRSGYLHYQSGQLEEALACFDICDQVQPNNAATLHMRALFLHGLKRYEEAVADGTRSHALDPSNPDTGNNVGAALQALNRHEEALPWFDRTLALRPELDVALYNKAVSLAKLGRAEEALAIHHRLRASFGPNSAVTELNLADLLINLGRFDDALAVLDRCDRQQPNQATILQLRSVCLRGLKQLERSLADSRRAHGLDPRNAAICSNIGGVLHQLGRYEEALVWLDMATAREPDNLGALNNKALALHQLGRLEEAAATYERVMAKEPGNAEAALGAAHLKLLNGDFAAGWTGREARWQVSGLPIVYPRFAQPMWRGENVAGKTILVYADEGIGDAIQLARYLPLLAAHGARVILRVHAALRPLLSEVEGVALCIANDAAPPPFDLYCPMLSLPFAFGTRLDAIPAADLPRPDAARARAWEERLPPRDRLRVGLAWAGNPDHSNDLNRSVPLLALARLTDVDASFISLQKDLRPGDRATLDARGIVDLTKDLADFGETAALVSCLDLVITVDTAVAHLAGALGRPTWIMLPHPPDYRWLLGRDDSPWYPSVRLFRQGESRDYAGVLDRVRAELAALAARHRNR